MAFGREFCAPSINSGSGINYNFNFDAVPCEDLNNCWIFFQSPEDVFKLSADDETIFDLENTNDYVSNEFFLVPISKKIHIKKITFEAKDLNQSRKFLNPLCIQLGKHETLRWRSSFLWFLKTGANLYSAYFLMIISFFLMFSFWFRKSGVGFSLLMYSIVSFLYLLSFSEYPRAVLDPVLASGGFHFPLRLLQDLCLVFVFYNFYQKEDSHNIIDKIAWVYAFVISLYLILLLVGVSDYKYYERIIIIMAPLVAAPMTIGAWFAFKLRNKFERKILIPISILLFCFQINDLLVFWGLASSYFTVRIYIPFIVCMALFLYFRRIYEEALFAKIVSERNKIFKEFIHDVRSPLAVLKIFLINLNENNERVSIIKNALDRIEGMFTQVEQSKGEINLTKVSIVKVLNELIKQKNIEYTDVIFEFDTSSDANILCDKNKLERVFSNLINNSYESYAENQAKIITIKLLFDLETVKIQVTDKGRGISKSIYGKLFKESVSSKENGKGIGLASSKQAIEDMGGKLQVFSREGYGTTVEIDMKTLSSDVNIELIEEKQNQISNNVILDFVLIDDDKYIRLAWEYYAQNSNKRIKTFPSVEAFLEQVESIQRDCVIYLDLNLNGEKSLKYLEKIDRLGFKKIFLATGEELSDIPLPKFVQGLSGKLPPIH